MAVSLIYGPIQSIKYHYNTMSTGRISEAPLWVNYEYKCQIVNNISKLGNKICRLEESSIMIDHVSLNS